METLSLIRITLLVVSAFVFLILIRRLVGRRIEGLRLIGTGFSLIMLNVFIGSLFHSPLLPKDWTESILPIAGFMSGYIGLPAGLIGILLGIYRSIRSLLPHLDHQYANLVDSLDGIVWEADPETFRFTFVSKKCRDLLGFTEEEWLSELTWEKLIHPTDAGHTLHACSTAVREKRNHALEFRVFTADRRVLWVRDISTVIVEKGKVVKLCGVLFDITEKKQAEVRNAVLSSLTLRLNSATDAQGAATIISNVFDELFSWDACTLDLYFPERNIVQPVLVIDRINGHRQAIPPSYSNKPPSKRMAGIIQQGGELILRDNVQEFPEDAIPFGNVSRPSASIMTVPIRNGSQVIGILSLQSYTLKAYTTNNLETLQVLADQCGAALERIKAEEALRGSEVRYRQVVENASDLIFSVDPVGTFTYANMAAVQSSGYSLEELRRLSCFDLILPEHRARVSRATIRQYLKKQAQSYVEYPFQTKSGGIRWYAQNANLILEMDKIVGFHVIARDITRQKKAEEELRTTTSQLKTLFESLDEVFFSADVVNQKLLQISPACEKIYGYPRERFFDNPMLWREVVHLDDRSLVDANHARLLSGEAIQDEHRILRPDGSIRWVEAKVRPARDTQGGVVRLDGVVSDITERKLTQEALRRQTSYFQQLFEQSPEGIVLLDCNDRVLDINESFTKIFKYSLDEIRGCFLNDIIVPAARIEEAQYLSKTSVHEKVSEWETLRLRKDGSSVNVSITGYPIFVGGKQVGIYGIYGDISRRKKTEEELKQSEERYRSLVESAKDIILTISPKAFVTSLNQAFGLLTEWEREEWIGKSFTDLFHPEDLTGSIELFHQVLQSRTTGTSEFRMRTLSGEYLVTEFTMTPQVQGGVLVGVMGIARDISARKKMDEQLRQTQKMESIGTLAGGIAHDFNNILGIILGYTSLLDHPGNDLAQVSTSSQAITKAVKRGADLVRQILTIARKTDVSLAPVRVNDTVKELGKMLQDTFPKTIDITLRLDPKTPIISIDSTQLIQSLLNLSVNARDAMANKGALTIETRVVGAGESTSYFPSAAEQAYVRISVKDTGTGMDEKTKQRIFEPFFTTKALGQGTGLGLAVVYGVVQTHKGFIEVESEVGRGTSFHLYFPLLHAFAELQNAAGGHPAELPTGTETILVVEDEEAMISMVSTLLEKRGFKVVQARNGIEAVEIFQARGKEIDCVISDLGLPKMGGAEAFGTIRNLDPDVRVIIASGFLEPSVRSNLSENGVMEFIQKPYDPRELLETVREVLDRKVEVDPSSSSGTGNR